MANNGVSQHFKIDGGLDVSSDSQFATLSANQKIVYKPNSEKYIKNPNYSNVFDKAKSFATDEELSGAVSGLEKEIGDTKTELGTVKSKSITSIDDANASGVCSCKNTSGTQVDTFTCHVSKSASNPTLSWGSTATIGTIDGTAFKVTMPANPNTDTKYSAGTALTLNGTTFNHNNYLNPQTHDYYHPCIAPDGFRLADDGKLWITGLSLKFNEQGHVIGYKNADPVYVDLSSIVASSRASMVPMTMSLSSIVDSDNLGDVWYIRSSVASGDVVSSSDLHSDYSVNEHTSSDIDALTVTMNGVHPEDGTYRITSVKNRISYGSITITSAYIKKIA